MIRKILFDGPILFMALCELTLICIFSSVYEKKWNENLWLKLGAAVALIFLVEILDYYFVDFNTASTTLEPVFCFIATFFFAVVILKIRKRETFYCMVWIYFLTEVTSQTVMPLADTVLNMLHERFFVFGKMIFYCLAITLVSYLVKTALLKKLRTDNHYHVGRQKMLYCIVIMGGYLLLSNYQFIFWLLGHEPESASYMITLFRLSIGIACILILYIQNNIENMQRTEQELYMIQQMLYWQEEQYRISQENIDLINRKCHDLKYQMEALRRLKDEKLIDEQLKELERSAMIYDSIFKTGNPVLDTVLTEKSLVCEANQIQMTCMADGKKLDFIGNVDLYTIFGNALDNAIESVMKQEEVEKRIIQVSVFHEKNLLMIRVRNYCGNRLEFRHGIPVSTKQDKGYHGFGLKSIQYTAEKYGGGIVCQNPQNFFVLQILIPLPA
ncbi:ATP-binding protein [Lachnospiraceae bacterium]|nr:ATP-binding protein [Lachnospiraceae bacterium]